MHLVGFYYKIKGFSPETFFITFREFINRWVIRVCRVGSRVLEMRTSTDDEYDIEMYKHTF